MRIICPEHYCLIEIRDQHIVDAYEFPLKAVSFKCPDCNAKIQILNILLDSYPLKLSR